MSLWMTVLLGAALPVSALLAAVGYKVVEAIRIVRRADAPMRAERRKMAARLREIRAEVDALHVDPLLIRYEKR